MKHTINVERGLTAPIRILYTSDVHTNAEHIKEFLSIASKADVNYLIINGDITPKNIFMQHNNLNVILRKQEVYLKHDLVLLLKEFREKNPKKEILLDLGNDDFKFNRYFLEIQEGYLLHLLHMRVYELTPEIGLVGYMSVPPTPFGIKDWEKTDIRGCFPASSRLSGFVSVNGAIKDNYVININSEDTIENDLKILSEQITTPFIFVAHAPPMSTNLDMISPHFHVGSSAIRNFITQWSDKGKLVISLHGHIHESPVISGTILHEINNTLCVNIGQTDTELNYLLLTIT